MVNRPIKYTYSINVICYGPLSKCPLLISSHSNDAEDVILMRHYQMNIKANVSWTGCSWNVRFVKTRTTWKMLNQCKISISSILILISVIIISVNAGGFDAKKDVSYEMYCRFSNTSTNTTLHDIGQSLYDQNILKHENFIVDGYHDNRILTGVQNCRWNWNPNRPTRIFIHGYYSDHDTLRKYANAYLERDNFNFIAINWLRGAKTINYVKARFRILEVGKAVARFIDYLVSLGLNLDDLICVGHSLGAHTCGIVGKNIKSHGKLASIIALDPALPLFHLKDVGCRLHYNGESIHLLQWW